MSEESAFGSIVKSINSNKEIPAVNLVKDNPFLASIVSKLNQSNNPSDKRRIENIEKFGLANQNIQEISNTVKRNIKDNENIKQLFPDIEICKQILVSVISSPKDMMKTELNYTNKTDALPADISLALCNCISDHMDNYYHVKDEVTDLLKDCLFETGSYIKAIIPESVLDDIINSNNVVAVESLKTKFNANSDIGILGSPEEQNSRERITALENFLNNKQTFDKSVFISEEHKSYFTKSFLEKIGSNIEITDNFNYLKYPLALEKVTEQKIKSKLSFSSSLEGVKNNLTPQELSAILYKTGTRKQQSAVIVSKPENSSRKNIGRPLDMKIPSESCIPVYKPYDPSHHVGYFIMLDNDGYPITANEEDQLEIAAGLDINRDQNRSISEILTQKARTNLVGLNKEPKMTDVNSLYSTIIERDLLNRLKNGMYGSDLTISNDREIYSIMLARALANKFTRLLYLPVEIVSYFAFDYHSNGIGKSLLDDVKILTSIRATLMFAKTMAMILSSINSTEVEITLDPDDPDPDKTAEIIKNEIAKFRQAQFPIGINSAVDLTDFIQRMGLNFKFKNHPKFPDMETNFSSSKIDHDVPDDALDEDIRKLIYMAFTIPPSMVDNGFESEFATTSVINNQLFNRRIQNYQKTFSTMFSDYVRKIVQSDAVIYNEMLEIIRNNMSSFESSLSEELSDKFVQNRDFVIKTIMNEWISGLDITLPAPDTITIEGQLQAFEKYRDAVDAVLDVYFPESLATSDLQDKFEPIKSNFKAIFMLHWCKQNGFMPELSDITAKNEDGRTSFNLYEELENHIKSIIVPGIKHLTNINKVYKAGEKDIEEQDIGESNADSGGYSSSSSDSDSDSDSGGGDDGFGGMDDFGDMGDFGGGDEGGDEGGSDSEF